ncbi:hypothetical protein F444_09063 [Phytophthora nicotianae P1976]|uniref:RxLR effector protein n=1 Tax=Phytophthora nicotianae P1976 TaxID=1317066 RepID=A0A081A8V8_PHYNI|nr:hypothetical protein F444_09063 [Phytophthora nicotianae P1976]
MRLSLFVLLFATVAAALLASGNTATLAYDRTPVISTSQDLVATNQNVGGEKRLLRYHDNNKDRAQNGKENADEEERKGNNLFSTTKLDEMLDGTKVMKRFKKWKAADYTTYNLPKHVLARASASDFPKQ